MVCYIIIRSILNNQKPQGFYIYAMNNADSVFFAVLLNLIINNYFSSAQSLYG